jgi:hypothetical protein
MVSLAILVLLMTILSVAFVTGAQVFRDCKALGDMEGKLRSAIQLLRNDLQGYHFNGNKRISDPNFWANGPPDQGFFRIWQQTGAAQDGGSGTTDLEGVSTYTSTGTWLHFTVNMRGNKLQSFFQADLSQATATPLLGNFASAGPPPTYNQLPYDPPLASQHQDPGVPVYRSQWAEVAWFLKPNGAVAGTTPLFALYRRQVLAVPDNMSLNWNPNPTYSPANPPPHWPGPLSAASTTGYDEISYKTDATPSFYFNTANDLTQPARRFGMASQTTGSGPPPVYSSTLPSTVLTTTDAAYGGLPLQPDGTYPISPNGYVFSDVVVTDVVSFDVRVLGSGTKDFADLASVPANSIVNPAFSNVYINGVAQQVYVYDTWSSTKDGSYDYSNWNLSYPATGPTTGTNTSVPLRRLFNPTTGNYATSDVQIQAIQVSIRIWDFKTGQARQATVVVAM